jgi:hypothetical protein
MHTRPTYSNAEDSVTTEVDADHIMNKESDLPDP